MRLNDLITSSTQRPPKPPSFAELSEAVSNIRRLKELSEEKAHQWWMDLVKTCTPPNFELPARPMLIIPPNFLPEVRREMQQLPVPPGWLVRWFPVPIGDGSYFVVVDRLRWEVKA
jgi:hypothetical protein